MNKASLGPARVDFRSVDAGLFFLDNRSRQGIEVLPWNTPLQRFRSTHPFAVTRSDGRLAYVGRVVIFRQ